MKWREFEKSIPSWYHLEEHCRLSIREYWLSWTNRVAEAKIEITHLILNGDPVYHLEEQGERGREEWFGEIHDRHPTPRLSQVRCNHVNLLKKWDDWKISTKEKVGPKIHSEKRDGRHSHLYGKNYLPLNHANEPCPVARFLLDPILGIVAQNNREVKALGVNFAKRFTCDLGPGSQQCGWASPRWSPQRRRHPGSWEKVEPPQSQLLDGV